MMHTTLYTLFMPPKDCFGDFGFLCGFTATRQILNQIKRTFNGDVTRPSIAAFIHPSLDVVSDIPGLAWMWMRLKDRGYNLLHAKVGLMGFRRKEGSGYVIRLAVSTGNWTQDPLTDSIDLFWSIDVDVDNPNSQECADVQAAWAMFVWLRKKADCSLIERDYDGHRPDSHLSAAVDQLPRSDLRPRFIDSREQALFPQVVERLGRRKKANRLIVGSGYFEAAGDGDAGLVERMRQTLVQNNALTRNAQLDLFLNPQSCQGLAERAEALIRCGWALRRPYSALHGEDGRLHAKFVLLAGGSEDAEGRLYLGSGNLSRVGFETAASGGGNIEAGVIVDLPSALPWRGKKGLSSLLPVQFNEVVSLTSLQSGGDFIAPEEPLSHPPVSWLIWDDEVLSAPEGVSISVIGQDNQVRLTPCEWPAPAPAIVTLSAHGWRLPVIADGVLVVPRSPDMTVEDILAGLGSFPEAADLDGPEDGPEGGEAIASESDRVDAPTATYAIRRMMGLLVRLGEIQADVDPRDWQRWCRELRQNLSAIAKQETEMLSFFRSAGANPLPVLADPRMCPVDADIKLLNDALVAVAGNWGLEGYPSLWSEEAA
ncbi:hypothetical protein [Devosia sp. RR2S18]|uniref:hypothetical protein n=1 Tax=Devosia rhizosphaerae TaxID=3049774 RepID=UPI0025421BA3|nr:hypothetical protein [Devosia sp. RR2S18]WIJ25791.1 hypothetical protein QOV41_03240 [Devosia sp. RR2S18]